MTMRRISRPHIGGEFGKRIKPRLSPDRRPNSRTFLESKAIERREGAKCVPDERNQRSFLMHEVRFALAIALLVASTL